MEFPSSSLFNPEEITEALYVDDILAGLDGLVVNTDHLYLLK